MAVVSLKVRRRPEMGRRCIISQCAVARKHFEHVQREVFD
jgi:hypothetical protein